VSDSLHFIDMASTDSTVLAFVMKTLNERFEYGLKLFLLSVDEGITGYRDDSLEVSYCLPRWRLHLSDFSDSQAKSAAV